MAIVTTRAPYNVRCSGNSRSVKNVRKKCLERVIES